MSDTLDLNALDPNAGNPADDGGGPDQAVISEALEQGWVPQEQWHGRPDEWTDAETFVKRGREINPILRKTLKKKDKEIDDLRAELMQMKGTVQELAEHRNKIEKLAYDRAMQDLRAQRVDALQAGDGQRLNEVEEAIDQLKDAKPTTKVVKKEDPVPPQVSPAIQSWMEANSAWYNEKPENADLVDFAHGASARLINAAKAAGRNPDPEEVLAKVTEKVRAAFPQHFKQAPPMFDGGGSGAPSGSGKGKNFNSLPADAKAQFERFYKAGYYPNAKKEDAQAQYFADYQ